MARSSTSFRPGNRPKNAFKEGNIPPTRPQEHYKRIGSIGGKTNKGRRYNVSSGFALVNGRWRNPNKPDFISSIERYA